jgi:hypothetical protein
VDVFALSLKLKEEGGAAVKAAVESLGRSFKESEKNATALDDAVSELKGSLKNLATLAAAGTFFKKLIDETSAAQFAQAQLQAALKSTGNVAGQSVDELNAMAGALQETTVFADDAVTASQSLLLTFTKVQGDIFPRATKAIADVAQAMGTDLQGATIQVGKALNDPIHGIAALARSGIQFSEDQKAMIASLVETNQLAEAQTIILKELETQFGGSAEAAGKTLGGAIARLGNAFGELFEISESASEGVVGAIEFIIKALNVLNNALTSVRQAIQLFGLNAGVLFEEIKAFLTMSGDEYRAYMKVLQQYEAEQENIILGLTKEETATRKVAAAKKELTDEMRTELKLNSLKPVTFDIERMTAQSTSMPVQAALGPKPITFDKAKLQALLKPGATDFMGVAASTYLAEMTDFATAIATAFKDVMVDSFAAGIEAAIATGSITQGFKTLTKTMLSGLGSMLIQFGSSLIPIGALMEKVRIALLTLSPQGLVAAGIGMIAIGAAMKGAASAAFGGGAATGAGSAFSAPSMGVTGAMTLPTLSYGPTAAGSSATIAAMAPMNVTIVGPNDPAAQRQMQELMRNAQRRGSA